ncbi:MAG: hypothetical protein DRH08_12090 [Deltaproteobacteria bacterium]|nr:MAG: hypothetical protein DRH08_12090 [Deltaproteobacteria bacterium]
MESLNGKITRNTLLATEWNQVPSELQNLIVDSGQALTNADLDQLGKALAQFYSSGSFWLDTGAADAYVVNPAGNQQLPPSLDDGLRVTFRPGNDNTGVSTLNLATLGVKSIVREDLAALVAGDLSTTADVTVRWDNAGDRWLLALSGSIAITGLTPKGFIDGLQIDSGAADLIHDIDSTAGSARSADATLTMTAGAFTKQADATWAKGTLQGGYPAVGPAIANNTWYRYFIIGGAGIDTDFGFDSSATAANLLADASSVTGDTYDEYRQIGWVKTNGAAPQLWYFEACPGDANVSLWNDYSLDQDDTTPVQTRVLTEVHAPPDCIAMLIARIDYKSSNNTGTAYWDLRAVVTSDQPADGGNAILTVVMSSGDCDTSTTVDVCTDSSSQIATRFASAGSGPQNATVTLKTRGFRYVR